LEKIMFEKASRVKLRFTTSIGLIAVEDLWDLKLSALDAIARSLHKALEDTEISFIKPQTANNEALKLRFEIVKYVITVKLAEQEEAKTLSEKAARKAHIHRILASKQDEALQAKTAEELIKELEALG
jgi:hypothetical protein